MAEREGQGSDFVISDVNARSFFSSAPPLKDGSDIAKKVKDFIAQNAEAIGMFFPNSSFLFQVIYIMFSVSITGSD